MVACELCGKSIDSLVNIKVAGTNMNVCDKCRTMGKESKSTASNFSHSFRKYKSQRVEYDLVENYLSMMNSALAKKGINLQQLARVINIKESTLHKYFSGKLKLDIDNAMRIAKFFEIELIEEVSSLNTENSDYIVESENTVGTGSSRNSINDASESLSLGELIKKQMNKNG